MGLDESGTQRLALVKSLTSVLQIPISSTVLFEFSGISEASCLTLVAAELISMAIINPLFPGQKLAIHNAPESIIRAIITHASFKGAIVTFTADSLGPVISSDLASPIELPVYPTHSDLTSVLPSDLVCFVDFSTSPQAGNELMIKSYLAPYCRKEDMSTLCSPHGIDTGAPRAMADQVLKRAVSLSKGRELLTLPTLISLETLARGGRPADDLAIIDWTGPNTALPARITRFETNQIFKADKTYWLVGLSGGLGISLCNWMIERGVRHLVLTSRTPKIDPRWIKTHEKNGVTIRIMPWYVSFAMQFITWSCLANRKC